MKISSSDGAATSKRRMRSLPHAGLEDFLRVGAVGELISARVVVDRGALRTCGSVSRNCAVAFEVDVQRVLAERGADVVERAVEHDLAAMDQDDLVGHPLRLGHHVRGEKDGLPLLAQLAQEIAHEHHVHRIEPRLRLVEDDELGIVQQRADELHFLLVALRQLLDLRVALVRSSKRSSQRSTVRARRRRAYP